MLNNALWMGTADGVKSVTNAAGRKGPWVTVRNSHMSSPAAVVELMGKMIVGSRGTCSIRLQAAKPTTQLSDHRSARIQPSATTRSTTSARNRSPTRESIFLTPFRYTSKGTRSSIVLQARQLLRQGPMIRTSPPTLFATFPRDYHSKQPRRATLLR